MAADIERTPVVVIGGGVAGLAVAAATAEHGSRVIVLERGAQPCGKASAASFAWANAHDKHPEAYAALNRDGIDRHARLSAAESPGERWYRPLAARFDDEMLDEGGVVDVAAFARAQIARVSARGGVLRTGVRAARIEARGPRPTVTLSTGQTIAAERVVCAAGAASVALLGASGMHAPALGDGVGPRGFVVRARTARPPRTIDFADALAMRPDGEGVLLQSLTIERRLATDGRTASAETVWPEIRALAAARGLILDDDALIDVREASRPAASDGLPVVGEVAASVHLVVAHSGVTLAPILGELVAHELRGVRRPELDPFRPDRLIEGVP